MFGYITIYKDELKFKEFDQYRSYYCGLCRSLKKEYGIKGQISLNYDLTFVALVLSSLYESPYENVIEHCPTHIKKQTKRIDPYIDYARDMNLILTYLKCEDDWLDEKKGYAYLYQKALKKNYLKLKEKYPKKIEQIELEMNQLHHLEQQDCSNKDEISGCFGRIFAQILLYQEDEFKEDLYELGFYLGKFIYLLDAYDDVEKDRKKKNYNVFKEEINETFENQAKSILEQTLSRALVAFECLPIIENENLIKNILYIGLMAHYNTRHQKRMEGVE